ncbi:uncharacterized protein [Aegilops tauschii subsp. strangulata]|uniref:Myb-like protein J n=1 Tax=Aegilops tauschii TaxID=37682 RepID=N1QRK4_AEGTA
MDARVSVEEARSIITRFNNKGSSSDRANHNNHDNNPDTKLRMWYPCETMQQDAMRVMEKGKGVIAVTEENKVEALENKMSTYEPVITLSTRNDWAQEEHCSLWSAVNERVSVQEPRSIITWFNNKESSSDGANQNIYNKKPDTKLCMWYPCETMQQDVMEKGKGVIAMTEENKVEALENNMSTHQPVIAPSARNYSTQEEHWFQTTHISTSRGMLTTGTEKIYQGLSALTLLRTLVWVILSPLSMLLLPLVTHVPPARCSLPRRGCHVRSERLALALLPDRTTLVKAPVPPSFSPLSPSVVHGVVWRSLHDMHRGTCTISNVLGSQTMEEASHTQEGLAVLWDGKDSSYSLIEDKAKGARAHGLAVEDRMKMGSVGDQAGSCQEVSLDHVLGGPLCLCGKSGTPSCTLTLFCPKVAQFLGLVRSLWYAMNARVGVEEPGSIITGFNNKESSPVDENISKYNNKPDTELRMQYHCESMQQEGTRVMEESKDVIAMSEDNNVEVLENEMSIRQPVIAPSARIYWTKEEHWNFLDGLSFYGRGKWKEISKDFVTTKTPVQVSSHAHKYFKRLERKNLRRRYSINDLGLEIAEPWIMGNSSSA